MSTDAARQPKGVPVGGQFTATEHTEPDVTLTTAREQVGGLTLEGQFSAGARDLAAMVSRAGVCGTVKDESRGDDWYRLTVDLPSGDELSVGVAVHVGGPRGSRTTAVTAYFRPGDDAPPDVDLADDQRFGGILVENDVREVVRHTLMQAAARAQFRAQFPDVANQGLALEFIGEESVRDGRWRMANTSRRQEVGARFTLDGSVDLVASTFDGNLQIEVDKATLDARTPHLLALTAADVNRRLGVTASAGQTPDKVLASTLAAVVTAARSRLVWVDNIDESKVVLP